eukprot:Seg2564.7 transcript_id=Seg2564.7/GoldUCD/mRNA.D3Y31 product="Rho GTPase-activating protein 25" protein_id=Seg2564.7/GoldUCD/D3Y31
MRLIGKFGRSRRKMTSFRIVQPITPPTKEGPLIKYRNFWSGWMQRYFKLDKCYLHYFEAKHAPEPIDSVPRGSIISAKPSDAFQDRQFVFEIQQKSGTLWYAQASSMDEMIEWIRVLSPIPTMINPDMYPTTTAMPEMFAPSHAASIAPSVLPSCPETSVPQSLYPAVPQNIYYEYNSNMQQLPREHGGPPPPYSEIVNGNQR